MKKAIQIQNVSMKFNKGKLTALNDISFNVSSEEIFGLIGPDGAGKTTLFRILTTLILPTTGSVEVLGFRTTKDYKKIREFIGYVPGRFSLYQDLTIEENIKFFASVYNTSLKGNYDLIKDIYFHLEPFKNRKAGKLSGGMKQKLALCCALINRPKVLFLDEPTTGIDPVSRVEFWETIKNLRSEGITIFVSTPYMDEAILCDRIALIYNGNILRISQPEELVNSFEDKVFKIQADNLSLLKKHLLDFNKLINHYYFGDSIHLIFPKDSRVTENEIHTFFNQREIKISELSQIAPTIEDCFIKYLS